MRPAACSAHDSIGGRRRLHLATQVASRDAGCKSRRRLQIATPVASRDAGRNSRRRLPAEGDEEQVVARRREHQQEAAHQDRRTAAKVAKLCDQWSPPRHDSWRVAATRGMLRGMSAAAGRRSRGATAAITRQRMRRDVMRGLQKDVEGMRRAAGVRPAHMDRLPMTACARLRSAVGGRGRARAWRRG